MLQDSFRLYDFRSTIVSFAAVIRVVTQRWEEGCVTTLITAAKETRSTSASQQARRMRKRYHLLLPFIGL